MPSGRGILGTAQAGGYEVKQSARGDAPLAWPQQDQATEVGSTGSLSARCGAQGSSAPSSHPYPKGQLLFCVLLQSDGSRLCFAHHPGLTVRHPARGCVTLNDSLRLPEPHVNEASRTHPALPMGLRGQWRLGASQRDWQRAPQMSTVLFLIVDKSPHLLTSPSILSVTPVSIRANSLSAGSDHNLFYLGLHGSSHLSLLPQPLPPHGTRAVC